MIKLVKFKREYTKAVTLLIMKTFKRFNGQDYFRKSAIQEHLDRYDPKKNSIEKLYKVFRKSPIFYLAVENKKIIGTITGKANRIGTLFVDGKRQKKGIGRLLVKKLEAEARKLKSGEIKISASLYAVLFYKKMGYKKTTGVRNFHGLKVYPMKKVLN